MRWFIVPGLLLFACALSASAQPAKTASPLPALPDGGAWEKLPPPKKPPLPEWAKVFAGPLPKTTAKMLELDYLHREKNPLGARLAARIRWTVADALDSKYGRTVAKADLDRAELVARPPTEDEAATLAFAKKLTLEGHAITDSEFAALLKRFTPEQVTAIVHTVACANFQNRIALALGVKGEAPIALPVATQFDLDAAKVKAPERPSWDDLKSVKAGGISVRVEWGKDGFEEVNAAMDRQKERTLRVPLPSDAAIDKLPPRERDSAKRILWNTVSAGYQPELTRAWFACLSAYYEESKVDRVFTNSMFWVVTRTNDCFY